MKFVEGLKAAKSKITERDCRSNQFSLCNVSSMTSAVLIS